MKTSTFALHETDRAGCGQTSTFALHVTVRLGFRRGGSSSPEMRRQLRRKRDESLGTVVALLELWGLAGISRHHDAAIMLWVGPRNTVTMLWVAIESWGGISRIGFGVWFPVLKKKCKRPFCKSHLLLGRLFVRAIYY